MNQLKRNILANYCGRGWSVLSVYAFLPLYLKYLGVEAYGLVGFFAVLLGVFAFTDFGLSATLNREMARLSAKKSSAYEMHALLRTIEIAYWCLAVVIAISIYFSAGFIADNWLNTQSIPEDTVKQAVRLMGCAIAIQFPATLYLGGLLGLEKQVHANAIQIVWGLLRGGGAVLILWLVSPSIQGFFYWQIFVTILYCLIVRVTLRKSLLPTDKKPGFEKEVLFRIWHYAAGMTGITIISTLLIQSDKLIISKMLSLKEFGYYSIAVAISQAPIMLASPIANALFPRFTGLSDIGAVDQLSNLYSKSCRLVTAVVIPVGLTLALFSNEIIRAWTGSETTAAHTNVAASLLVIGSIMLALQVIPYKLALASGWTKLNLKMGIISLVCIIPLMFFLVGRYGIIGGGMSWLILNAVTLPIYIYFLHRRILPGQARRWFAGNIGKPLLIVIPFALIGRLIISSSFTQIELVFAITLFTVTLFIIMLFILADFKLSMRCLKGALGVSYGE